MTIHKLSVGDGYTYLTRQVAGGDVQRARGQDASDYYTQEGNPPGRWIGRGAHLLGLDGQTVTEDQMKNLFGHGAHPNAEAIIDKYIADHTRPGMTDAQIRFLTAAAEKHAQLGRRFGAYRRLEPFDQRVADRLDAIAERTGRAATPAEIKQAKQQEAAKQRCGVAGFDLVFAPVKSAALVWALHPDVRVRQQVKAAHDAAVDSVMELLEEHAAHTRAGTGGVAQLDTKGLIAARFDHFDSRAGDPNLHTHIPVANKVLGRDGKWRSLDARGIYAMTVAASEHYNTRFETEMVHRLGVTFTDREAAGSKRPVREIDGIPAAMIKHFSRRRLDLEARYKQLIAAYRADHGTDPPAAICHKLARQATLDTRPDKPTLRSLKQMRQEWEADLIHTFGGKALRHITSAVPTRSAVAEAVSLSTDEAETIAASVVRTVASQHSTWTRWNLHAEAERTLRAAFRFPTREAHDHAVEVVMALATSPAHSIRIDAPSLVDEPDVLRRADGESVFHQHGSTRYTSQAVLDAEQRLLGAAKTPTDKGLSAGFVTGVLDGFDTTSHQLDPGQRHLAAGFATTDRLLAVGIGPGGAGKTTAMKAYAHTLTTAGHRLIPLATSANSAAVLAADLDTPADNLHKFLWEHSRGHHANALKHGDPVPESAQFFALKPGDVVLVDEAGQAGTFALDQLITIAKRHGAQVRLLGDHRQLSAVESGGALRLIAAEAGAFELDTLHRFSDPAEARATLKLREGDASGLDHYEIAGRIFGGSKDAMIEKAYTAWHRDLSTGRTSVMIAATNADVTALAARARTDRIRAGHVKTTGVDLHDGNTAGVGDWVITRHNHRGLRLNRGKDFVRNGDIWTVIRHHRDGSLSLRHHDHRGTVRIPADYVAEYVELAYATTATRIQGATVDTAHALVTDDMAREHLYVAASRARHNTSLYAVTHVNLPVDEDDRLFRPDFDPDATAAREILETVVARESAERSATETIRDAQNDAESLATLVPQYGYALEQATREHYTGQLTTALGPDGAAMITNDGLSPLIAALLAAETAGWKPHDIIALAADDGPLELADSPAALLAWRIRYITDHHPAPPPIAQPTAADARRYARALARIYPRLKPDPDTALTPPPPRTPSDQQPGPTISASQVHAWANAIAEHLGVDSAEIETHRAWPQLATTLAGHHAAGNDVHQLITTATRTPSTDLTTVVRTARRLATPATVRMPAAIRHHQAAITTMGPDLAHRARISAAWPAVITALTRAEQLGRGPETALRCAISQREFRGARDISQLLAWRIGRQNRIAHTDPSLTPASLWRSLAWSLKAAETTGTNPTRLLRAAALDSTNLTDFVAHVHDNTRRLHHTHQPPSPINLPWLHTPTGLLDSPTIDDQWRTYLHDLGTQINHRVTELTAQVHSENPEWLSAAGPQPRQPRQSHAWNEAVAVMAAYRDQHRITTDDPHHPLGPYPTSGHAGHHPYWHAATALLAATQTTSPTPPSRQSTATGLSHDVEDQLLADITTAVYTHLPTDEQHAINRQLAKHLHPTVGEIAIPDHATHPSNTHQLAAVLSQRGHLPNSTQLPSKAATAPNPHTTSPRNTTSPVVSTKPSSSGPGPQPHAVPAPQAHPQIENSQPRPRL
ncbi:MobF family relaxase [Stackebrandtia nassauensis]|uniref:TrwC relaxase n=1 Tax=Stackebrandtia nassauensis (strain DSM 44728 / CIP 108903 / NRRL B-16338 / NBRC 102104 / LLR-40K-21) TaxID=446470 RepID=D3PV04_STANL|nr:MobF family relaxase [Stackebrandtia nassauensis]ADD45028.1 TrwC relaxase [Stackebrandtia nassauensis DSM 44728]